MPTTRRFRSPSDPAADEKIRPQSRGSGELQIRIPCKGRKVGAVIDDLVSALATGESRGVDLLIVLEDLGMLADSVSTLIKGLSRLLVGYPRTITFWEASGLTEAFLSAMEPQERPTPPGP